MRGGTKTKAGKNRIVPIHSKIRSFVEARIAENGPRLISYNGKPVSITSYRAFWSDIMECFGMSHVPHECRHTFETRLDSAGANRKCIDLLRSCIHNRLSKVWRREILTIASAEEMEISKSLLSRLEWLSQERVRSTTQRQGSFSHWCGLIFSEISTSRPSCSFMSETKVPRYPASAQNFWIDGYRSYARLAVDIPPFVS